MRVRFAAFWPTFKAIIPTVVPLVILVSLACWGHVNHWQFSHDDSHDEPTGPRAAETSVVMDSAKQQADRHAPGTADLNPTSARIDAGHAGESPDAARIRFRSLHALQKTGIQTAQVGVQPLEQRITANGTITYNQTLVAQLSARVPGTVWRIEKQLGESFRKGDVLAVIEAVDVGRAKADFLQAVVLYKLKKEIAEQLKAKDTVIPYRQILEAQAEAREANIRMVNAQQTLVNYGLPGRVDHLEDVSDDELSRRIQFLGLPESITSTLDPARTTASLVPLLAPFDGVVIGHDVSLGETISPTEARFIVADTSRMWLKLEVRKEDAASLSLGQQVVFQADGVAGELASTISWISTEVDEKTRTVSIRAEVVNPLVADVSPDGHQRRMLRANTFGTGQISVRKIQVATVVPQDAMQWEGSHWVVFARIDDTTFEARPIELGIAIDDVVEIRQGISPGETIATTGSHLLKSEILKSRLVSSTN